MPFQHLPSLIATLTALLLAGCATISSITSTQATAPSTTKQAAAKPVKIGIALGGGAARGFAHIGVIKVLEAQGITLDVIIGTSAGAVVGALYAAGNNGFELQKLAHKLDETKFSDWSVPDRGVLKGEGLQKFVNDAVANRPIEALKKPFAAVATDLNSGDGSLFRNGNTGMAVRASAAEPSAASRSGLKHTVRIRIKILWTSAYLTAEIWSCALAIQRMHFPTSNSMPISLSRAQQQARIHEFLSIMCPFSDRNRNSGTT